MARYRSRKFLSPIHRIKHVVDGSATINAGAAFNQVLMDAVDAPVLTNVAQTQTGSSVNGIYLKVEVASNEVFDSGTVHYVLYSVNRT